MLCIRPFRVRPGQEFGCGQCLPCRINRRRVWTSRIVLEAAVHGQKPSAFFTLTYTDLELPLGGTLDSCHLEEFRYKLRYRYGPFRYYFVGEYGTRFGRPHYHGLLFGMMPSREELEFVWGHGACHLGSLSVDSAAYCAGYVTKKWTSDCDALHGRKPEFVRVSRRPGLGYPGLFAIINWLYGEEGARYMQAAHDVPQGIRISGKVYPLGRYLVGKLREEFGIASSDPVRSMRAEAMRLENLLPEVAELREFKRQGHYDRAQFYARLKRSKDIL